MKQHLQHLVSIVVAAFFGMSAFAQDIPDTLSTNYGDGADTYVGNDEKKLPDANEGASEYLVVRNHEVRMRIILLRFDITDNPRFDEADQAYIGLHVNYAEKMGDDFREISVYGMTDDDWDNWDETMVNYNTAPGLDYADLASYALVESKTTYLTSLTVPADTLGWVYSEPTAEMDEFINDINKNHLLTFILLVEEENTGDEVRFDTKEKDYTDTVATPPILHSMESLGIDESTSLSGVTMEQNFPNPFIGITTLSYNLKEANHVELTMYNMLGARVATLVNEFQGTGEYNVDVDVDRLKLSPGVYYAKIHVGVSSQTIKMIICE